MSPSMDKDAAASEPALFDEYADDYEAACHRGLVLSGESRDYFATQRVLHTARWVREMGVVTVPSVLDFGCGVGHSIPHFREQYPEAEILGLDVSTASVAQATRLYGGPQVRFAAVDAEQQPMKQTLAYCNGVFHHIAPEKRLQQVQRIRDLLQPGGLFAFWENNPWNPGTRWVMSRIPFDHDAITLTPPEARRLLAAGGLEVLGTRYHFYFPRLLAWLRSLERYAVRWPLGAQYCVLARKPFTEVMA
ncbi:MAG TPA: methyltransferase domain-containing protein [Planctomycetaceae bacterium]|nr:methyltransferase domain-containing protein [Planctomycetaceae bacterium]